MVHFTAYFICCAVLNCIFRVLLLETSIFVWHGYSSGRRHKGSNQGFQEGGEIAHQTTPQVHLPYSIIFPFICLKTLKSSGTKRPAILDPSRGSVIFNSWPCWWHTREALGEMITHIQNLSIVEKKRKLRRGKTSSCAIPFRVQSLQPRQTVSLSCS